MKVVLVELANKKKSRVLNVATVNLRLTAGGTVVRVECHDGRIYNYENATTVSVRNGPGLPSVYGSATA